MKLTTAAFALCALTGASAAQDLVVIQGADPSSSRFYGGAGWSQLSADIDAVFNSVNVSANLDDAGALAAADALWVDQRWTAGTLSGSEIAALQAFIDSGRRVVMIGENSVWSTWNTQILSTVGGTFAGDSNGLATPTGAVPALTAGVGSIGLSAAGVASGGTALFDINFATLWGDNAVSVLDINIWQNTNYSGDNQQFGRNVIEWLAVPAPGSAALAGIAGLAVVRRRR